MPIEQHLSAAYHMLKIQSTHRIYLFEFDASHSNQLYVDKSITTLRLYLPAAAIFASRRLHVELDGMGKGYAVLNSDILLKFRKDCMEDEKTIHDMGN